MTGHCFRLKKLFRHQGGTKWDSPHPYPRHGRCSLAFIIHDPECLVNREITVPYRYVVALQQSSYSTVDFVQRASVYFGYAPDESQADNGSEFNHTRKPSHIHPLDVLCNRLHITHKTIRPAPWHNGKVECSHRSNQERFFAVSYH